ncbi:MAG: hypothetical protein JO288_10265 [Hyphomicrobiales bacterium]|nr:hypothetical protein [Hyphomicrobiales bacterium]
MKKRIDALNRIGKLQASLHELERSRLIAIEQQQASLGADLKASFETPDSADLAYGEQAKLTARRIRSLQRRLDALSHERKQAHEATKAHGIRAKLAEKAVETAVRAYRDQKERKELAELIDRALAQRDASPT